MNPQSLRNRLAGYDCQKEQKAKAKLIKLARRCAAVTNLTDQEIDSLERTLAEAKLTRSEFLSWVGIVQQCGELQAQVEAATDASDAYDQARQNLDSVHSQESSIPMFDNDKRAEWQARRTSAMAQVDESFRQLQSQRTAKVQLEIGRVVKTSATDWERASRLRCRCGSFRCFLQA
jgi:hypothetical protein